MTVFPLALVFNTAMKLTSKKKDKGAEKEKDTEQEGEKVEGEKAEGEEQVEEVDDRLISTEYQMMMFVAGLRGAIALVLVLGLPKPGHHNQELEATTVFIVLVTNIVLGGLTVPAVRKLGIPNDKDGTLVKDPIARLGMSAEEKRTVQSWDDFDAKYFRPLLISKKGQANARLKLRKSLHTVRSAVKMGMLSGRGVAGRRPAQQPPAAPAAATFELTPANFSDSFSADQQQGQQVDQLASAPTLPPQPPPSPATSSSTLQPPKRRTTPARPPPTAAAGANPALPQPRANTPTRQAGRRPPPSLESSGGRRPLAAGLAPPVRRAPPAPVPVGDGFTTL